MKIKTSPKWMSLEEATGLLERRADKVLDLKVDPLSRYMFRGEFNNKVNPRENFLFEYDLRITDQAAKIREATRKVVSKKSREWEGIVGEISSKLSNPWEDPGSLATGTRPVGAAWSDPRTENPIIHEFNDVISGLNRESNVKYINMIMHSTKLQYAIDRTLRNYFKWGHVEAGDRIKLHPYKKRDQYGNYNGIGYQVRTDYGKISREYDPTKRHYFLLAERWLLLVQRYCSWHDSPHIRVTLIDSKIRNGQNVLNFWIKPKDIGCAIHAVCMCISKGPGQQHVAPTEAEIRKKLKKYEQYGNVKGGRTLISKLNGTESDILQMENALDPDTKMWGDILKIGTEIK